MHTRSVSARPVLPQLRARWGRDPVTPFALGVSSSRGERPHACVAQAQPHLGQLAADQELHFRSTPPELRSGSLYPSRRSGKPVPSRWPEELLCCFKEALCSIQSLRGPMEQGATLAGVCADAGAAG